MNACGDLDGLAIGTERRFDLSVPKKERLFRLLQRCKGYDVALGILETKADSA